MLTIYKDRLIHIEWTIYKGTSNVHEDFTRALVKCFLIGPNEKYLVNATAKDGTLFIELPQGLEEGAYSIEVIYVKNQGNLTPRIEPLSPSNAPDYRRTPYPPFTPHDARYNDRCIMRSRRDCLFAITEYEQEEEGVPTSSSGEVTLCFKTSTASYGYDGLSAYEIAVMRGDFNGSESEWLKWVHHGIIDSVASFLNYVYLDWKGSKALTRQSTPLSMRKKGIIITYQLPDGEVCNERNIIGKTNDEVWVDDSSWTPIFDLTLTGDVSISSKGTWIINGVDSGISAVGPKGETGTDGKDGTDGNTPLIRWNNNSIEASVDNGKTWERVSGYFGDSLYIKGYVSIKDKLPKNALLGDIYGVGPTYEVEDVSHEKPFYQLFVNTVSSWEQETVITIIYQSEEELPSVAEKNTFVLVKKGVDKYVVYKYIDSWNIIANLAEIYANESDIVNRGDNIYALVLSEEPNKYILFKRVVSWVNFGTYNSISAGVVNGIGSSETEVMSQKAVCDVIGLNEYPVFSESEDYKAGDTVNYDGRLHTFTDDHAAGAWIGTDAEKTSVKKVMEKKDNELEKKITVYDTKYPINEELKKIGVGDFIITGYLDELYSSNVSYSFSSVSKEEMVMKLYSKPVDEKATAENITLYGDFIVEKDINSPYYIAQHRNGLSKFIVDFDKLTSSYQNKYDYDGLSLNKMLYKNGVTEKYFYPKIQKIIFSRLAVEEWKNTVSEMYLFPNFLENVSYVTLLNTSLYGGTFIITYNNEGAEKERAYIKNVLLQSNNEVIGIYDSNNILVGYIVFSDIISFMSRDNVTIKGEARINIDYVKEYYYQENISNYIKSNSDKRTNKITEKVYDISELVMSYTQDSSLSTKYSVSTFSGHGQFIGTISKKFRYIKTRIKCNSYKSIETPVTNVLVQFLENDYTGEIIKQKLFKIEPIYPGENKYVLLDFGEDIELPNIELWMNIRMNTYSTLYKSSSNTYPAKFAKLGRYFTKGDLESNNLGVEIMSSIPDYNADLYWEICLYANTITELNEEQIDNIQSRLEISVENKVDISLPNKIYAIVGDTIQLFYRGIIKAVNPYRYDILVSCSKGITTPRYFEYTPKSEDIGSVDFSIYVKDDNGNIINSKKCKLITAPQGSSPSSQLSILCFGDSLTSAGTWCRELDRRITGNDGNPSGLGLTNVIFAGQMKNDTTGYFGKGGWQWSDYTTSGRNAYRFYINSVTSVSVGAIYSNNGNTFTVIEVNITDGSGSILCSVDSLTPAPQSSGFLTKTNGDGDLSLVYSSVSQDSQNPLWDYEANKMTFKPYVDKYCNGKVDVVITLLSWNGQTAHRTDFSTVITEIKKFANTLHEEYPSAKLKICGIQIPSVNGGMGANYGAVGNYGDWYGMLETCLNQNDAFQDFANLSEYSDYVEFINISSQVDSEYNMPYKMKNVNIRSEEQEMVGTNGVHPSDSGYYQIADAVFRNIVANYCN